MRRLEVYNFNTFDEYWKWKREHEEFRKVNLNIDEEGKCTVGVILYD